MHPREKPITNYLEMSAEQKYQIRQKKIEIANKQNTAEMNLRSIHENMPEASQFINMKYVDAQYADPFGSQDSHAPRRSFNEESPMTKKMVHNYT